MIKLKAINECTGCGLCLSVCPKNAISLKWSKDGFLYPKIDNDLCVSCGRCTTACFSKIKYPKNINKCFAGFSNDQKALINSSSGGMFFEIAKMVLDRKGSVYGVCLDTDLLAKHVRITNLAQLNAIMKSKYIQSDMTNIYKQLKMDLDNNIEVLFVGTPCQTDAIQKFLKKRYENLLIIDLICHGVPSPKIWLEYIKEEENVNNCKVISADFRDKTHGWEKFSLSLKSNTMTKTQIAGKNKYMQLFLGDKILRESCYSCKHKKMAKNSDITLGDYWGIPTGSDIYNPSGVSLLITHSSKGERVVTLLKQKSVSLKEISFYDCISINTSYFLSPIKPKARKLLSKVGYENFYHGEFFNTKEKKHLLKRVFKKMKILFLISIIKGKYVNEPN